MEKNLTLKRNNAVKIQFIHQQKEISNWLRKILPEEQFSDDLIEDLQDGVILCKLINKLQPGSVTNIKHETIAFKQMQTVEFFLKAGRAYGAHLDFSPGDLVNMKDPFKVIGAIHHLAEIAESKGFEPVMEHLESEFNMAPKRKNSLKAFVEVKKTEKQKQQQQQQASPEPKVAFESAEDVNFFLSKCEDYVSRLIKMIHTYSPTEDDILITRCMNQFVSHVSSRIMQLHDPEVRSQVNTTISELVKEFKIGLSLEDMDGIEESTNEALTLVKHAVSETFKRLQTETELQKHAKHVITSIKHDPPQVSEIVKKVLDLIEFVKTNVSWISSEKLSSEIKTLSQASSQLEQETTPQNLKQINYSVRSLLSAIHQSSPSKISRLQSSSDINLEDRINSPEISSKLGTSSPSLDSPKLDSPKLDSPKLDSPKLDSPKLDSPKLDSPKLDSPSLDSKQLDPPKVEFHELDPLEDPNAKHDLSSPVNLVKFKEPSPPKSPKKTKNKHSFHLTVEAEMEDETGSDGEIHGIYGRKRATSFHYKKQKLDKKSKPLGKGLSAKQLAHDIFLKESEEIGLKIRKLEEKKAQATQMPPARSILDVKDKWTINFEEVEIVNQLSAGSSGEVYMGYYLGTSVAIKWIPIRDDIERENVEREYTLMRDLNHPNIVQFLGMSRDNLGGVFFLTEFVEHGDLFDLINFESHKLNWKNRVFICLQLSQALYYLHTRTIIHRDIKSQNVLMADNFKIKLCDFGLATYFDSPRDKRTVGSELWFSPEIAMGQTDYDHRIDVFSYGIVVTELILGEIPQKRFPEDNYRFDSNYFLDHMPLDTPDEFSLIVLEATQFEPSKRPSFKDIMHRLKAILKAINEISVSEGESNEN